jgi:sugar lactone lactonase YvrE
MLRFRSLAPIGLAALAVSLSVGAVSPAGADSDKSKRVETINLPTGWRPEGITAGRGKTLYIGSLANGAIWKADSRTGEGAIFTPGATGRVSVGVHFDKRTNRLWVAGGGTGEIRAVDASSGAILQTYTVPGAAGAGFLNDVEVTRTAVYVTDSRRSLLAVIPTPDRSLPPANAVTTLAITAGVTGNGITTINGKLIVVQSGTGLLFRVDPATGGTTSIDLGGYLVTNGDGLEPGDDGQLFVVRNRSNLIAQLQLNDDVTSGRLVGELRNPNFDIPSTAALQGGRLWAVNARFGTAIPPDTSAFAANSVKPLDDDDDDSDSNDDNEDEGDDDSDGRE